MAWGSMRLWRLPTRWECPSVRRSLNSRSRMSLDGGEARAAASQVLAMNCMLAMKLRCSGRSPWTPCGLQHRLTDQMVRQEPGPQLLRPHLWRFALEPVRLHRHFDLPERDFRSPASAKQCRQLSAGDFGVIQQLCHPGAMWRSPVTGGESWRWQSRYTALTCTELRAGGRRFPDQTSLGQTIVDQTILGQASRASPV